MKVFLKEKKYKGNRLFILYISAEDTSKIFKSPQFLISPPILEDVRFQLTDGGEGDEKPVFRLEHGVPNAYVMHGKTGFETNEQHLEYLVNLEPIPMVFSEKDTCVGYVKIEDEMKHISDTSNWVFNNIMIGVIEEATRKDLTQ